MLSSLLLVISLSVASHLPAPELPNSFEVDCRVDGALERVLKKAEREEEITIYLSGMCQGGIVIERSGVELRGLGDNSGFEFSQRAEGSTSLLTIRNSHIDLRNLNFRGGIIAVDVSGRDAEVSIFESSIRDSNVGIYAEDTREIRVLENSSIQNTLLGVFIDGGKSRIQDSILDGNAEAIILRDSDSILFAATIQNSSSSGVLASGSRVRVFRSQFHNNTDVHLSSDDRSDITIGSGSQLGSPGDETSFALGSNRLSSISTYGVPNIYGNVAAINFGVIFLGADTIHGFLQAGTSGEINLRTAVVTEGITCNNGGDVYCGAVTTASVFGCPSSSCIATVPSTNQSSTAGIPMPEFTPHYPQVILDRYQPGEL